MTVKKMAGEAQKKGIHPGNIVLFCTILSFGFGGIVKLGPVVAMPDKQREANKEFNDKISAISKDIGQMQQNQAVQTEVIKTLADAQRDAKDMRRDIDKNTQRFEDFERRIHWLESQ
ncbi:hypothetical protein JIN85_14610 [Luteolibacter pohnpeiensis]|uniref:Uncharacterized protein n=1 Tax=Luteolibacter pohnpeiensis TaxID=454153 RepID=A0A934S967_9BACT|nr:hypothetical protein [Luteolibacter pohnpeiensis]MBK1883650.1 hypothetical protein [Luteolibacter pohnpeiensis]